MAESERKSDGKSESRDCVPFIYPSLSISRLTTFQCLIYKMLLILAAGFNDFSGFSSFYHYACTVTYSRHHISFDYSIPDQEDAWEKVQNQNKISLFFLYFFPIANETYRSVISSSQHGRCRLSFLSNRRNCIRESGGKETHSWRR